MEPQNSQSSPPPQQSPAPQPPQNPVPHENKKLMSVLAYLGILVLVPLVMAKDDPEVKFHIKQGLVLFCIEAAMWVITSMLFLTAFWQLVQIINIATLILSVIGIINVLQDKQKPLPLVGSYSSYFNI